MYALSDSYNEVWQNCLSRIRKETSDEEYVKWFKPIVPLEFDGTTLRLRVPDHGSVAHIERNYISFFKPIIQQLFGQKTRVRYAVPRIEQELANGATNIADTSQITSFAEKTSTANIKNPFVIPGLRKVDIDPQLNPDYCFENFIEGDCNRLTRSAGVSIALNPGHTPFNPLFIYGDSGLGKTHIAQAIGMEVKQRNPEARVLYVTTNKFQAQFQNAAIKGELNDFIHFYQMIDVLIVDDIQELSGKERTQNTFFNIFNHLHLSNKQLILTSDRPPIELTDINQRLITRFKWGLSTQLLQPDYETKLKIIHSKASKMGVEISDDVAEFLATNITANIREIEGALSSIVAHSSFLNRKITEQLAKEVLKVYVKYSHKEITIDTIERIVCEHFNLTSEKLKSNVRTREIAQARQIAMYLSKQHTKSPLAAIGAAIGGKNHATVLHACKAVSNLMETDKIMKQQIDEIEKKILIA